MQQLTRSPTKITTIDIPAVPVPKRNLKPLERGLWLTAAILAGILAYQLSPKPVNSIGSSDMPIVEDLHRGGF